MRLIDLDTSEVVGRVQNLSDPVYSTDCKILAVGSSRIAFATPSQLHVVDYKLPTSKYNLTLWPCGCKWQGRYDNRCHVIGRLRVHISSSCLADISSLQSKWSTSIHFVTYSLLPYSPFPSHVKYNDKEYRYWYCESKILLVYKRRNAPRRGNVMNKLRIGPSIWMESHCNMV